MKKKQLLAAMISTSLLMGSMMIGCGSQAQEEAAQQPAAEETTQEEAPAAEVEAEPEAEQSTEADTAEWKVCTEDEAKAACPRLFKAPDDAVVNGWSIKEVADSENGVPGPVVSLDFRIEGKSFTAYAQYGAGENDNISGMDYDWTVTDDVTLANWGEGNMKGKSSRFVGDGEMIDLCTWYDYEIGIAYAVFVEAEDLDGFDIQAIAEQMYDASNEPLTDAPEEADASQNPVSAYAGQYYAGRGNLSITPKEDNTALIEVWWGSSAAEHSEWVMHGTFDEATKTITYSDCEKHDFTLNEDGEVESDVVAYTDGSGNIKCNDDNTIVWTDDQDHIADDLKMEK